MVVPMSHDIPIELVFERTDDGRYRVTSDDVPGFYMAGNNIDFIHRDLNEVIADLLRLNSGFIVSEIRWFPSLSDVKEHLKKPPAEAAGATRTI
jgi:hypothetical protein